jgi:hypothetical protein
LFIAPDHDNEPAAGFQYPTRFSEGIGDGGGILEGVETCDYVVGLVRKGQLLHFAYQERVGGESMAGDLHQLDRGVQTGNKAGFGGRQGAEKAGAAADIQQGFLAAEVQDLKGVVIPLLSDRLLDGRPFQRIASPQFGLHCLGSHNGSVFGDVLKDT